MCIKCSWRCYVLSAIAFIFAFALLSAYFHLFRFNKFNLLWISYTVCIHIIYILFFLVAFMLEFCAIPFQLFPRVLCLSLVHRQQRRQQQRTNDREKKNVGFILIEYMYILRHTVSPALVSYLIRCRYGTMLRIHSMLWTHRKASRYTGSTSIKRLHTIYMYTHACLVHAKRCVSEPTKYTNRILQKSSVRFFSIILFFFFVFFLSSSAVIRLYFFSHFIFIPEYHSNISAHFTAFYSLISVSVVDIFSCFVIFVQ